VVVVSVNKKAIIEAPDKGKPLDRFIPAVKGEHYACPNCTTESFRAGHVFETNGVILRPVEECPKPEGLTTEWEQNFPSGKMLVGNDFRWLTQLPDNRDINTRVGTHLQILDYAAVGLALGFGIGNTCPSVFRMADGSFEIGDKRQPVWAVEKVDGQEPPEGLVPDGDDDEEMWWTTIQPADRTDKYDYGGDDSIEVLPDGCEEVASICTDLWAYSIIDFEEGRKRAFYNGCTEEKWQEFLAGWTVHVADIEPGKYRFQHFHNADRDAHNVVMARFERVGEAEPCFDYVKAMDEFDVHLSQAVHLSMERDRFTRIYFGDKEPNMLWAYAKVMRDAVGGCVPNRDWHPNGFPNNYLFTDINGVEIGEECPRLAFQVGSNHNFGGYGSQMKEICTLTPDKMFGGIQPLNRSFAIGVGRLLESIIGYGLITHQDTSPTRYDEETKGQVPNPHIDHFDVDACRKTMAEAIGWWDALIGHYPHVAEAMPEFTEWMEDKAAVERWVANFDLGPEKFDRGASEAKMAAREVLRKARVDRQWVADHPGITVVYQGQTVEVAEPEGSPDHVFVIIDGEPVEVLLTDVALSEESKAALDEHLEQRRADLKMIAKSR